MPKIFDDPEDKRTLAKELRAQGLSYAKIGKIVGAHTNTVMHWFIGFEAQKRHYYKRRANAIANGLCNACCKAQARPGKKECQACADRNYVSSRRSSTGARQKVLEELGGVCVCTGEDCWHLGPCIVIDKEILTVDHIDRTRLQARSNGTVRWLNYLKELRAGVPLQLLCPNCHYKKDVRREA